MQMQDVLHVSSNLASMIDPCFPNSKVAQVSICTMRLCDTAFVHVYDVPHTVIPVSIGNMEYVCAPLI